MAGFVFGGNQEPWSYDELQRKREIAAAIAGSMGTPRNVGEGLAAVGKALAVRGLNKRADSEEERMKSEFDESWAGLFGGGSTQAPATASPAAPAVATPDDLASFNASLARTESGGNLDVVNSEGYSGRYQFGQARLDDFNRANGTRYSTKDLLGNELLTETVQKWHVGDIDNFIDGNGLNRFEGQTINGVPITRNGMRAMAHLGGNGGMQKFLESGGRYNPADSNGTSLADYARTHGSVGSGGGSPVNMPSLQQLAEIASSPFASPSQKMVAETMMQRVLSMGDPSAAREDEMAQIQLETARLDLQNAQNPQKELDVMELGDGRKYYVDPTGEQPPRLVNPDMQAPEATPDVEGEGKLRKEFAGLPAVKDFQAQAGAYGRIVASADQADAAGDLALIFNYMKLLDPGSVVRESEFATAANAAGIPERVRNMFNRVQSGERLAPEQRQEFVGRAGMLYRQAEEQHDQLAKQYGVTAQSYGLDPDRAITDFRFRQSGDPTFSPRPGARPGTPEAQPDAPQPSVVTGDIPEVFTADPEAARIADEMGISPMQLWESMSEEERALWQN